MVKKTVSIDDTSVQYLQENCISLSRYIKSKIQEDLTRAQDHLNVYQQSNEGANNEKGDME